MAKEEGLSKIKKNKKRRLILLMVELQVLLIGVVLFAVLYYNYGGYAEEIQRLRKEAVALVRASGEETFITSQTCMVYDVNGRLISYISGEKGSDYVEYAEIPDMIVKAMVSIEDKRFYSHYGVDPVAVLRAVKSVIETGELSQGGSTITMQLARNIYLDNGKRWERKIKETFIATELEKYYSKNKIMEYYLNNIYFANGYYGIKAACNGYFNCELGDLTLSQAAFLCAIPNSPTRYNPLLHKEATLGRRDRILKNMYEDGVIDEETYQSALQEEIVLDPAPKEDDLWNNYVDTYVYHCATKALMEEQGFVFRSYFTDEEEQAQYDEEYDELYTMCRKMLVGGGYKIYTSIDLDKQEALQTAVDDVLAGYTELAENGVYKMQGAAVCIDNDTGCVVAIVGGRDQDLGFHTLNRAYQCHRQPGSVIKPLNVYTPYFETGGQADDKFVDHEISGGPKAEHYYGEVTVRFAVENSLNSVAWQIYKGVTPQVGLEYLKEMDFSAITDSDYILPTAIGGFTKGASPLEMAAGYATLENDGVYRTPTCVLRITDSDEKEICGLKQEEKEIYGKTQANLMTDVLQSVMTDGTGVDVQLEGIPSAGKTGTTNNNKDGWFVGYTEKYTTSVWVGCDMPQSIEELKGSTYPAWIWQQYMTYANEYID